MIQLTTHKASETFDLGVWIGQRLLPGNVVGFDGDLGAGKTWMAKGVVQGIGDFDPTLVKSPAYNLVHEYSVVGEGRVQPVIHIDFYRLETLNDTDFMLFSEILERPDAIVLVEWANRFLAELVGKYLSIQLTACNEDAADCREISIHQVGGSSGSLLTELAASMDGLRDPSKS